MYGSRGYCACLWGIVVMLGDDKVRNYMATSIYTISPRHSGMRATDVESPAAFLANTTELVARGSVYAIARDATDCALQVKDDVA